MSLNPRARDCILERDQPGWDLISPLWEWNCQTNLQLGPFPPGGDVAPQEDLGCRGAGSGSARVSALGALGRDPAQAASSLLPTRFFGGRNVAKAQPLAVTVTPSLLALACGKVALGSTSFPSLISTRFPNRTFGSCFRSFPTPRVASSNVAPVPALIPRPPSKRSKFKTQPQFQFPGWLLEPDPCSSVQTFP